MINPADIHIGDRVKFKAATRNGCKAVWRLCNGHNHAGLITVRFFGWDRFVVRNYEIIAVEPAKEI